MVFFNVSWDVKFRAFGIDFGHYTDSQHIPLPPVLQVLEQFVGPVHIYSYNDHGVKVSFDLVKVLS